MMLTDKRKAALFMVIAAFFYALVAAIVKYIEGIPVFEMLFFRTVFGTAFIVIMMLRRHIPFFGVNKIGLVSRGVTGFIAAACYYLALNKTPIAETVTISDTYPFIVVLLSALFLKEKIRRCHIYALVLSFIGTLLIIKPGFCGFNIGYIYAVLSSVFLAITYTILKHVRETDAAETVVFYYSAIAMLLCLPFMIFGGFVTPDMTQLALLVGLGLAATLYQWFLSTAYKYAPAGEVSIYSYTAIIFSSIMGIVLWGEYPAWATVAGMVAIAYGAYLILKKDGKPKAINDGI